MVGHKEQRKMTLKEKCKRFGLSINEVVELTGSSRETLRNWVTNKPKLLDFTLKGVYFDRIVNNMSKSLDNDE